MHDIRIVNDAGFPTGEAIIGAAAVAAALIAAWMAERRLKITLGAERGRLRDELDHDRSMRDLEELRRTLTDINARLASMTAAATDFLGAARRASVKASAKDETIACARRVLEEAAQVRYRYEGLILRVGGEDPLAVCLEMIDWACLRITTEIGDPSDWRYENDELGRIDECLRTVAYLAGAFAGIARGRFASELSQEEEFEGFLATLRESLTAREDDLGLELLEKIEETAAGSGPDRGVPLPD